MSITTSPETGKQNGGRLLNAIIRGQGLKNDAALARLLDMAAPTISKIRNGHIQVSDTTILRVHEHVGMPVKQIRELLGAGA